MRFRHGLFLALLWPIAVIIDVFVMGESLGHKFNILKLFLSRRSPLFVAAPFIFQNQALAMESASCVPYLVAVWVLGFVCELEAVDRVVSALTLFNELSVRLVLLGAVLSLGISCFR